MILWRVENNCNTISTYSLLINNIDDGAKVSGGRTIVDKGNAANFDKSSEYLQYTNTTRGQ